MVVGALWNIENWSMFWKPSALLAATVLEEDASA